MYYSKANDCQLGQKYSQTLVVYPSQEVNWAMVVEKSSCKFPYRQPLCHVQPIHVELGSYEGIKTHFYHILSEGVAGAEHPVNGGHLLTAVKTGTNVGMSETIVEYFCKQEVSSYRSGKIYIQSLHLAAICGICTDLLQVDIFLVLPRK